MPAVKASASGFSTAFTRLPWIFLLDDRASATVCAVASDAARPFTILVANGFRGLKAISRALVALSCAVFEILTACNAAFAAASCVLRAASFNAGFDGLYDGPYAVQKLIRSSKVATFLACPVSVLEAIL